MYPGWCRDGVLGGVLYRVLTRARSRAKTDESGPGSRLIGSYGRLTKNIEEYDRSRTSLRTSPRTSLRTDLRTSLRTDLRNPPPGPKTGLKNPKTEIYPVLRVF